MSNRKLREQELQQLVRKEARKLLEQEKEKARIYKELKQLTLQEAGLWNKVKSAVGIKPNTTPEMAQAGMSLFESLTQWLQGLQHGTNLQSPQDLQNLEKILSTNQNAINLLSQDKELVPRLQNLQRVIQDVNKVIQNSPAPAGKSKQGIPVYALGAYGQEEPKEALASLLAPVNSVLSQLQLFNQRAHDQQIKQAR